MAEQASRSLNIWWILIAILAAISLCACGVLATGLVLGGSMFAAVRSEEDEIVLDSVDVSESYLEGISLVRTNPAYRDTLSILGFTRYEFQTPIPAGQTLQLGLQALALRAGEFRGEVDVCINSGFSCRTYQVRTMVADG